MTQPGWIRRQTTMRGRLSMLLILLMVVPVAVASLVAVRFLQAEEKSNWQKAAAWIDHEVNHRLGEELVGLERLLSWSLDDLVRRAAAAGREPESWPLAFADLPSGQRPALMATWNGDRVEPPLPPAHAERLLPLLRDGRQHVGYEALPPLVPGGPDLTLLHVVIQPRPEGGTLVVLRDLAPGPDGQGLLNSLPFGRLIERTLTLRDRTVASTREERSATARAFEGPPGHGLPANLWQRTARIRRGNPAVRSVQDSLVVGARPILDLSGEPIGMVVVRAARQDFFPLEQFFPWMDSGVNPLLSKLSTLVGCVALLGLVLAAIMGHVAPRWLWSDIRDSTDHIFGSVARLRELAARNGRALNEQAHVVTDLTGSVSALESASSSIAQTTEALAQSAEQSARVSQAGNRSAERAQRSVLDVREQVKDISTLMDHLSRRCREIDEIIEYIDQLNKGTRKLSVNATIKSEDRESAARQLAYVAGEVRELAEQAADYTGDIERRVEEIQKSSETTLTATRAGRQEVNRCLEAFEELEAAFARILRWVDETTQFARGIESSTTTQTESLQDVTRSVGVLTRRARETEANFRDIEDAIDELATLGEEMMTHWKVG